MNAVEIVLIGSIVLLTMFGYIKYKDMQRELWDKAEDDWVSRISERVERLEDKDDCCKK